MDPKKNKGTDVDEASAVSRITAILSYSKGFMCSMGPGSVCLFEKTEEDSYRKSREIQVRVYVLTGASVSVGLIYFCK